MHNPRRDRARSGRDLFDALFGGLSGVGPTLALALAGALSGGLVGCGSEEPGPAKQPESVARASEPDGPKPGAIRFGVETAPAKRPGTIRLTSYNIENLFDDKDDPALSGDVEDRADTKPREERAAVAAAIREVDPDILCVQEVESLDALLWFRDEFLSDMGYEHVASIDAGNERGIEQAVLSRFPITSATNWPGADLGGVHPELYGDRPNRYAGRPLLLRRSPIRVEVEIPGADSGENSPYQLVLYNLHHKSGRYNDYWREAEARYLVAKLEAELASDPDANIVVLGDFNAQRGAASVEAYIEAGFADAFDSWDDGETFRMTHTSGRRIDLILFAPTVAPEVVEGSAFVLGTIARAVGEDWRSPAPEGYAADHYPVSIDLVPSDR